MTHLFKIDQSTLLISASALLTACDGTKKGMFYCFQCHMNFNSQSQLEQHTSSHKHQKKVNLRNQIAGQSRQREMTWDCEYGQRGISGGRSNYLERQFYFC